MAKHTAFLRSLLQKNWLGTTLAGSAVIVVMLALYVIQPPLIRQIDLKAYDTMLPLLSSSKPSSIPVIVDIDEDSLTRYGQWPWPRHLLARLFSKIGEHGALSMGVDILFSEPDRSSPAFMQEKLHQDMGIDIVFSHADQVIMDYDQYLAQTIHDLPMVLGAYARFDNSITSNVALPAPVGFVARTPKGLPSLKDHLLLATGVTLPMPIFWANSDIGFINMSPDMDGVLRRVPLLIRVGDAVYPSLALRSVMRAINVNTVMADTDHNGVTTMKVGPYSVHLSPDGTVLLPFHGRSHTYKYISAADILDDKVNREDLQGKVAFIGTSAPGLLDIRSTPFDNTFPGVEVHAVITDSIVSDTLLYAPAWTPGMQMGVILGFGIISLLTFGFARPIIYLAVAVLLPLATVYASRHFFMQGVFISPVYAILTLASQGATLLLLRFRQEEQQKIFLRKAFSRYVSPEIVKRITALRGNILAGEDRIVTIMFTDLRDFTSISERLAPQQVVALLNRYFTAMTAIVREHHGTVDKFIGDALMAFWNAPLNTPDHQKKAVQAAMAMQKHMDILNKEMGKELGLTLNMRVGLHTGKTYVGNMGSEELVNYTLIGDAVNLAARLESVCGSYGIGIAVSAETAKACAPEITFQEIDTLTVKGKKLPVTVFTPLTAEEHTARAAELDTWEKGLGFYKAGEFSSANKYFMQLAQTHPNEQLYAIYTKRSQELLANPPLHWDNIAHMTE